MCWPTLEGDIQVEERPRRHPNGPRRKRLFFVNDRTASRGSDEYALTGPQAQRRSEQEMLERQNQQQQLFQRQQQLHQQAQLLRHQQQQQEHHRRLLEQQQQQQQQQQRLHGVQPHFWNAQPRQQEHIPVPPQHHPDPRVVAWHGHDQARLQHGGGRQPHDDDIVAVEEWHPEGQPQYVEGAPRARMPAHLAPQRERSRRGYRRERSLYSEDSGSRSTGSKRVGGRRTPGFVEEVDSMDDLRQLGEGRRRRR